MAEPTTIIGEYTSVQGNLQGDEDLTVLGRVEGAIELDRTLVVEPSGVVKADVSVRNAVISGVVVGNVEASESVHIAAEGRMVGDISAPRVIIVDGAMFRGRIDMGDVSARPVPERPAPAEPSRRPTFGRTPPRTPPVPIRRPEPETAPEPTPEPEPTPTRRRAGVPAKSSRTRPSTFKGKPEDEEKSKAEPAKRRRTPKSQKSEPRSKAAKSEPSEAKTGSAKVPPPPKPRVAAKKRRVSVKKKG